MDYKITIYKDMPPQNLENKNISQTEKTDFYNMHCSEQEMYILMFSHKLFRASDAAE